MREIVFLLEEVSARVLVEGLFPRVVPKEWGIAPRFIVFEGKQHLEKQMERRLRGYLNLKARFIVLRDQDSHPDCEKLKGELVSRCKAAGRADAVVRIACRELESFYLGDLAAVESAFGVAGLARRQNQAKYRNPDRLESPARELERLTKRKYQKVSGSRVIAPHLRIENQRSRSFHHLVKAMRRLSDDLTKV